MNKYKKIFNYFTIKTENSIKDGIINIKNLIKYFKKKKYKTIGIIDKLSIAGSLELINKSIKDKIKTIIGCEITMYYNNINKNIKNDINIIIRNCIGYKNICYIINKIQINNKYKISIKDLIKLKGIIIIIKNNKKLNYNLKKKNIKYYIKILKFIKKHTKYLFIEYNGDNSNNIIYLSKKTNIKIISTYQILFIKKKDYYIYKNKNVYNNNNNYDSNNNNNFILNRNKINKLLKYKKGLYNHKYINKLCCNNILDNIKKWPISIKINSNKSLYNIIIKKINNMYKYRYIYIKRIIKELKIIFKLKYSNYYLTIYNIIKWINIKNIPIGPGRGSGASSLIAYILNISQIDPIRTNLIFERFLNIEKDITPDFDIDVCKKQRNNIIKYIKKKYKNNKVINIITFNKYAIKNSIKDIGKILGFNYLYINKINKIITNTETKKTLINNIRKKNKYYNNYKIDKRFRKIINVSIKIFNINKSIGIHAGGIIISPYNLLINIPIYKIKNNNNKLVCQFNKNYIYNIGLIKIDILGLKTLNIINNIIIKKKINYINIINDKTYNLIKTGITTGIFQLEGNGLKKILKKIKINNITQLINIISIYRPGPIELIDQYINKKNQINNNYIKNKNIIKKIIEKTNNIIIFQEQIIEIIKKLFNINYIKANIIRIAFTKNKKKLIKKYNKLLIKKNKLYNNIKKKYIFKMINKLKKCAGYSFNKAHASSYAMITYNMLWLKANYYIDFIITQLNYYFDNEKKINNIFKECYNNNINILTPTINNSTIKFKKYNNNTIIYGLISIKGLGIKNAKKIIKIINYTKNKKDILYHIDISKAIIKKLQIIGFFKYIDNYYYKNIMNNKIIIRKILGLYPIEIINIINKYKKKSIGIITNIYIKQKIKYIIIENIKLIKNKIIYNNNNNNIKINNIIIYNNKTKNIKKIYN